MANPFLICSKINLASQQQDQNQRLDEGCKRICIWLPRCVLEQVLAEHHLPYTAVMSSLPRLVCHIEPS